MTKIARIASIANPLLQSRGEIAQANDWGARDLRELASAIQKGEMTMQQLMEESPVTYVQHQKRDMIST